MNIVVCVKQVPGTTEVKMNKETNTIIREGVEAIINPFDMHAVEEGLRIKERLGGKVTVLSMGIPSVAELLKTTIGLGADDAVLLSDRAFAGADTLATSYALSMGIRKMESVDLVICGKQATDGDTAQVGPSLAEKLGWPHTTYVRKIEEINEKYIRCQRMTDDGYEVIEMPLPAVITVVKEINEPRLPSLKNMMRAKRLWFQSGRRTTSVPTKTLRAERFSDAGGQNFRACPRSQSEMIEGNAEEQARSWRTNCFRCSFP